MIYQRSIAGVPRISQNGLVAHFDAANLSCYPATGTTAFDISNSASDFDGTLTNGVLFSSTDASRGSFIFDGVDSYVTTSLASQVNYLSADANGTWSWGAWFKHNQDGVIGGLAGGIGASTTNAAYTSTNNLRIRLNGITTDTVIQSSISTSLHHHFFVTWDLSTARCYYNGSFVSTVNVGTVAAQTAYTFTFGSCRIGLTNYNHFGGDIPIVSVYDRALTSQEIKDYFQSTRDRFGV